MLNKSLFLYVDINSGSKRLRSLAPNSMVPTNRPPILQLGLMFNFNKVINLKRLIARFNE